MADEVKTLTAEELSKIPERDAIEIVKRFYGARGDVEARFMLGIMDGSIKGDVLEAEED